MVKVRVELNDPALPAPSVAFTRQVYVPSARFEPGENSETDRLLWLISGEGKLLPLLST